MDRRTVHIEGIPALEGLTYDDPAAAVEALFSSPLGLEGRIVPGPAPRPRTHRIALVGGEVEIPVGAVVAKGRADAPTTGRTIYVALERDALEHAARSARRRHASYRTVSRVVSVLGTNFVVWVLVEGLTEDDV